MSDCALDARETVQIADTDSLRLRVLLRPLSGGGFPRAAIALPHLGNGHLLGILGIGGPQHSQDGLNDELRVQGGHPVLVDSLRADLACVRLYTWMVDLGHKLDLGGLKRIVVREVQVDGEAATNEGGRIRSINVDVPDHHVCFGGLDSHAWDGGTCQVAKLLHNQRIFNVNA